MVDPGFLISVGWWSAVATVVLGGVLVVLGLVAAVEEEHGR